jgi:hypothetical protein
MADYIRREDALFALRKAERGGSMTALTRLERAYAEIREMPAADVAEVVRCKDCRYSKYAAWCEGYACCRTVGEYHHADFGCTAGELQTNGVTE